MKIAMKSMDLSDFKKKDLLRKRMLSRTMGILRQIVSKPMGSDVK